MTLSSNLNPIISIRLHQIDKERLFVKGEPLLTRLKQKAPAKFEKEYLEMPVSLIFHLFRTVIVLIVTPFAALLLKR